MQKISFKVTGLTHRKDMFSSFWRTKRLLSIKNNQYQVLDSSNTVCSIILPTTNDQEKYADKMSYYKASMSDLAKAIPIPMKGKDLLLLKVNQCVIDFDDYVKFNKITPYKLGHVISGIVRVVDDSIVILDDSLVSKVQRLDRDGNPTLNTLESHQEILQSQLFWSKKRIKDAEDYCASEYYWFISFDKLNFNVKEYSRRYEIIKMNPTYYSLEDAACGQTIYSLLANDPNKSKNKSPQTSANDAFMKAALQDPVFRMNMQLKLTESKLTRFAFLLGKDYSLKLLDESNATVKLT